MWPAMLVHIQQQLLPLALSLASTVVLGVGPPWVQRHVALATQEHFHPQMQPIHLHLVVLVMWVLGPLRDRGAVSIVHRVIEELLVLQLLRQRHPLYLVHQSIPRALELALLASFLFVAILELLPVSHRTFKYLPPPIRQ